MRTMAVRQTGLGLALLVTVLAGCQGGMPMMARPAAPVAAAPQTRAASVAGVKARIKFVVESEFLARDMVNPKTGKKDNLLEPAEARIPAADFQRADKSRDGKLDVSELLEYLHRDLYGPFNQKTVPVFKGLDTDASNSLNEAEFAKVVLTSAGPDGAPLRPTPLLFRMTDNNRDFRIDYDEFEDLMAWDEANLMPEYFRSSAATGTNPPVAPQPPAAKPPVAPLPPAVKPPAVQPAPPQVPAAPPAVTNPHVQAPGEPPHPEPDSFGRF